MEILIAAIFVVIFVVIVFAMIPEKEPEPAPAKPVPLTPVEAQLCYGSTVIVAGAGKFRRSGCDVRF